MNKCFPPLGTAWHAQPPRALAGSYWFRHVGWDGETRARQQNPCGQTHETRGAGSSSPSELAARVPVTAGRLGDQLRPQGAPAPARVRATLSPDHFGIIRLRGDECRYRFGAFFVFSSLYQSKVGPGQRQVWGVRRTPLNPPDSP